MNSTDDIGEITWHGPRVLVAGLKPEPSILVVKDKQGSYLQTHSDLEIVEFNQELKTVDGEEEMTVSILFKRKKED